MVSDDYLFYIFEYIVVVDDELLCSAASALLIHLKIQTNGGRGEKKMLC